VRIGKVSVRQVVDVCAGRRAEPGYFSLPRLSRPALVAGPAITQSAQWSHQLPICLVRRRPPRFRVRPGLGPVKKCAFGPGRGHRGLDVAGRDNTNSELPPSNWVLVAALPRGRCRRTHRSRTRRLDRRQVHAVTEHLDGRRARVSTLSSNMSSN